MKYALGFFPTDLSMQPVEFGRAAEDAGFESIWFPEHSHIPTSRRTPWGGREGAPPLPEHYWRTHDAIVALTAIAATTDRIRLGTGITLLAQRDPIWTAKEVASLDVISNGRVIFGIGYGWNLEEMENHGINHQKRRAIVREKMLAMKEIWTKDVAEFAGDHVHFDSLWSWPKPTQKPHPPIVIGGAPTSVTFRHVIEYADGWMPLYGRFPIVDHVATLRARADEAGRDPASIEVSVFFAPQDEAVIEELRSAGVDRVILPVSSRPAAETAPWIEELGRFASRLG